MTIRVSITRRHNLGNYEHLEGTVEITAPLTEGVPLERQIEPLQDMAIHYTRLRTLNAAGERAATTATTAITDTRNAAEVPKEPLAEKQSDTPKADAFGSPAAEKPKATRKTKADPFAAPAQTVPAGPETAAAPEQAAPKADAFAAPAETAQGEKSDAAETDQQVLAALTNFMITKPEFQESVNQFLSARSAARLRDLAPADRRTLLATLRSLG